MAFNIYDTLALVVGAVKFKDCTTVEGRVKFKDCWTIYVPPFQ